MVLGAMSQGWELSRENKQKTTPEVSDDWGHVSFEGAGSTIAGAALGAHDCRFKESGSSRIRGKLTVGGTTPVAKKVNRTMWKKTQGRSGSGGVLPGPPFIGRGKWERRVKGAMIEGPDMSHFLSFPCPFQKKKRLPGGEDTVHGPKA